MFDIEIIQDRKFIIFKFLRQKNENNKFSRIARNSMFDRKKRNTLAVSDQGNDLFLKKLNNNMNANIIIDMKETKSEITRTCLKN